MIAMLIIAVSLVVIGLVVNNGKTKRKSVMIRNVKYRQVDEPAGMIDYSRYHEGLGGEE